MDPVSLTSSIIAILQLTQSLTSYASSVRNASVEQRSVAVEASNLSCLLTTLRFRVEDARSDDPWFNQVKLLGTRNGPLTQLQNLLELLVKKIPISASGSSTSTPSLSEFLDESRSKLTWKFTKKDVGELLNQIERLKTLINLALVNDLSTLTQKTNDTVNNLVVQADNISIGISNIQESIDDDLKIKISQWLALPDPSVNYQAALKKRQAGTGLWLTKGSSFEHWKSSKSSAMWLHGKAGCGKTVLISTALEYILQYTHQSVDSYVSYFFFDFNDREKQSWVKAIRSLSFQLCVQMPHNFRTLKNLYEARHNGSQQPADADLVDLFRDCIAGPEEVFVLLDALDECADREPLLDLLEKILQQRIPGLHILMTSRYERDIQEYLDLTVDQKIDIQHAVIEEDITTYIHNRLENDRRLKKWPPSTRNEIAQKLMTNADGMFRWVYCQLESLRSCIRLSDLRRALSSLPKDLDETYGRMMKQIELQGDIDLAVWLLQWLCFSLRPLRLSEVNEILAMRLGDEIGFWPEERLSDPFDITRICSSLISCVETIQFNHEQHTASEGGDSDISTLEHNASKSPETIQVRLAHFSVKEYLLSERSAFRSLFAVSRSHEKIAEGCIHYLIHACSNSANTEGLTTEYPLVWYAINAWSKHAREVEGPLSETTTNAASRLIFDEHNTMVFWQRLLLAKLRNDDIHVVDALEVPPVILTIASLGLTNLLSEALARWANIEAMNGHGETSLNKASSYGYEEVIELLLDRGADVETKNYDSRTPLYTTSIFGHKEVAKLLLDRGADVESRDKNGRTPLYIASFRGHNKVVELLLDQGADIDARDKNGQTPLYIASRFGHKAVVKLLLEKGADIDARANNGDTALDAVLHFIQNTDQVLHSSILQDLAGVIESLISKGAVPT